MQTISGTGRINRFGLADILVRNLLRAYSRLDDTSLWMAFEKNELIDPGDGSTAPISMWIGTECTYTPKQ